MNKLDKAKDVIALYINQARCGIFNTPNIVGDTMTRIYDESGLEILICYYWEYFEVFGLTNQEFRQLEDYYNDLRKNRRGKAV